MQKKAKLRLRDIFVVVICVSVCVFSLYLFWKDLNSSSTRKDKDQIATIEFKRKIAQRKFNDRTVWERLQQNSPLYNSDTIRTAEGAAATVTFNDGTVLELHENTMLQVSYSEDGGLQIAVNDGNIDVDTTGLNQKQSVALSMDNGSVVKLESGSKVTADSDSDKGNSFKLQSGNATISSGNGKSSQSITSGETVKIAADGEIKKEPLTVTSISSDTKLLAFDNQKSMSVNLKWNTADEYSGSKIIVQTSYDKDFKKIASTFTAENKNSLQLDSPVGKMYWRAYPEGMEAQAAAGKITVESVAQVAAVAPVNGSSFAYRQSSELPKIQFSWTGNDYADHYRLEVSKNQDMSNPVINEDLTTEQIGVKNLTEGNYFWRVTPYYKVNSIGYGEPTKTAGFSVELKDELTPPKLSIPAQNGKITFTVAKETPVTFQWKSDVKQADYNLEVASDKDFKNIVYQADGTSTKVVNNFSLDSLPAGQYFWKVTRTSVEDEGPMTSEIRSFFVEKYVPGENKLIYPPANYGVEKAKIKDINFMWKLASDYSDKKVTSVLQLSPSSAFDKNVTEIETDQTEARVEELNSGTYYWRVGIKNEDGIAANFTSGRQIKVLNQLGRPALTSPAADSTIVVSGETKVHFAWTAVKDADYYKLKVYDLNNKLIDEASTKKQTEASLSLAPAAYKCSVQAFTEETELSPRRAGKVTEVNFTVRGVLPVQLLSPVNKAQIKGLTALQNPVVITWKQGDKIARSQFILRKVQANGVAKIVQTIDNPKTQIRLNRLEAGTYQWTIKASSSDGLPLDAQNTFTFTVTEVPPLQTAKLNQPVKNQKIDSDYLKKNRSIYFDWAAVEGATDYKITVYQKNANGSLKKIYEEKTGKTSEARIKDLSILDIGEFEWNVTAYAYAKDGFEEQKSQPAVGNFKIDFALPGKVQTIDPGKLYGE